MLHSKNDGNHLGHHSGGKAASPKPVGQGNLALQNRGVRFLFEWVVYNLCRGPIYTHTELRPEPTSLYQGLYLKSYVETMIGPVEPSIRLETLKPKP